ncbi:FIG01062552: hypothetical protein [Vibrio cholerae]|nr:FIG01062552: hypothetical protein [Vibrio cholerae]
MVHCRTGSLENKTDDVYAMSRVHCRTGSLESTLCTPSRATGVHCRTGSLEIDAVVFVILD